jgi:predicted NBD/HSP70 family sugar kinase
MTDEKVSEPEPDRKRVGRDATITALLSSLIDAPADISAPRLSAVSALVVDAIRDDDEMALSVAARGLQRLYRLQRRIPNATPEQIEHTGVVVGLLRLVQTAADRVVPPLSELGVAEDTHAFRFLSAVTNQPGMTGRDLMRQLEIDQTQVSRAGRTLIEKGLARKFPLGRSVYWEATARGKEGIGIRQRQRTAGPRVTFGAYALPRLMRDADLLRGFKEAARLYRSRLVSPDTQVLMTVLAAGEDAITQREIERATNLSGRAVALIIEELAARDVVTVRRASDNGESSIAPNSGAHCVIGVTMMPERLIGVVTDLRAKEQLRYIEYPAKLHEPSLAVDAVARLVQELRSSSRTEVLPPNIIGLGVELGGHVDERAGTVRFSPNLDWPGKVDLRTLLEDATNLCTVVENDANSLAIFEQLSGDAVAFDTFAVVLMDRGIGAGVVVDNQLVRGATGAAGELGHLPFGDPAVTCACGHQGCVETVASVGSIVERANTRRPEGSEPVDDLSGAARMAAESPDVLGVFETAGTAVGRAIVCLLNLFNPQLILVRCAKELDEHEAEVLQPAKVFRAALDNACSANAFSSALEDCQIHVRHVEHARHGAWGAAAAVLGSFVQDPLNDRFFHASAYGPPTPEDFLSVASDANAEEISREIAGREIVISDEEAAEYGLEVFADKVSEIVTIGRKI